MTETHPILNFTDADLKATLQRAIRTCIALAVVSSGIWLFTAGWRSSLLSLVGAAVSIAGIYEWQQLIGYVNARLDQQKPSRSTARVVTMFFLRLGGAAIVVYVSLKYYYGRPYPLLTGLGLAVLALTIEAVKLVRSW